MNFAALCSLFLFSDICGRRERFLCVRECGKREGKRERRGMKRMSHAEISLSPPLLPLFPEICKQINPRSQREGGRDVRFQKRHTDTRRERERS